MSRRGRHELGRLAQSVSLRCAQYYAVSPHNGFPSEVRRVVRCAQDAVHNCRRRGARQTKPAAAVWSPMCPASPSGSIHGPASRKAPESGRVRPQRRAAENGRRAPGAWPRPWIPSRIPPPPTAAAALVPNRARTRRRHLRAEGRLQRGEVGGASARRGTRPCRRRAAARACPGSRPCPWCASARLLVPPRRAR